MKFDVAVFFEKFIEKNQFSFTFEYLNTYVYIFIIYRSVLLRMRNVSDKSCRGNQNTHFVFCNFLRPCRLWDIAAADRSRDSTWALISHYPDQEGNKLGSMSGTRAISTTSRRELSSRVLFFFSCKAPKEIHAILTETLACFLPARC